MTNFKIKSSLYLPTSGPHTCHLVTGADLLAHLFKQTLVMSIYRQIALPVVNDEQTATAAQPIGIYNLSSYYGAGGAARGGLDDNDPPGPTIRALCTKTCVNHPLGG